jgi:hypothetical protein
LTSSAVSVDSVSDSSEPVCEPLPSARSSRTAEQCSLDIGPECPSLETSAPLLPTPSATRYGSNQGGGMGRTGPVRPSLDTLTSSAADFPVRTSRSPERVLVLQGREAGSGPNTRVSLASYDPATSSWRTSQLSVLGGLEPYLETWPRSGLMRSGIAYQLPTWVPLTDETGSGLLPTPNRPDGGRTLPAGTSRTGMTPDGKKRQVDLQQWVCWWPTPRSADADKGVRTPEGFQKERARRGNEGIDLPTAVWVNTPRSTPRTAREYDGTSPLGCGGLNPTWVEWLMGFPLGWTVLEPSVTPSSRRSSKSSAEPS